jgi:hypothetical protein
MMGLLELIEANRPAWQRQAACRGQSLDLFFPEGPAAFGTYFTTNRSWCLDCPVKQECADAALQETEGMWGGTTPRQRRARRVLEETPSRPRVR